MGKMVAYIVRQNVQIQGNEVVICQEQIYSTMY